MNKLSTGIFLIVIGIVLIISEMDTKKKEIKINDRKYDSYYSARTISNIAIGILFILGGLFNLILL